jgi:DNA-binding response OmpR family regulator
VLSKERPDLVITDIAMPRLNGIEMIKSVRHFLSAVNRVPILVLTGCFRDRAWEAISAGANRAFAKPVDPEILLAQVKDLLNPPAATSMFAMSASTTK